MPIIASSPNPLEDSFEVPDPDVELLRCVTVLSAATLALVSVETTVVDAVDNADALLEFALESDALLLEPVIVVAAVFEDPTVELLALLLEPVVELPDDAFAEQYSFQGVTKPDTSGNVPKVQSDGPNSRAVPTLIGKRYWGT